MVYCALSAPSGPPTNLRVIFVNATSMVVAWSPPGQELRNGIIQNYKICFRSLKITEQCEELVGSQNNYTVSNLIPFTVYDVIVNAATHVGYGPSTMITNRTAQAGQYLTETGYYGLLSRIIEEKELLCRVCDQHFNRVMVRAGVELGWAVVK